MPTPVEFCVAIVLFPPATVFHKASIDADCTVNRLVESIKENKN